MNRISRLNSLRLIAGASIFSSGGFLTSCGASTSIPPAIDGLSPIGAQSISRATLYKTISSATDIQIVNSLTGSVMLNMAMSENSALATSPAVPGFSHTVTFSPNRTSTMSVDAKSPIVLNRGLPNTAWQPSIATFSANGLSGHLRFDGTWFYGVAPGISGMSSEARLVRAAVKTPQTMINPGDNACAADAQCENAANLADGGQNSVQLEYVFTSVWDAFQSTLDLGLATAALVIPGADVVEVIAFALALGWWAYNTYEFNSQNEQIWFERG